MTTIGMLVLIAVIVLVIFFVGFAFGRTSAKIDGILRVDDVSDTKTRWVFDMQVDPETIKKKTYAHFKVIASK